MATILLISDSGPSLELVRSALVVAGHEVLVAKDPSAVRRQVDLAIVDLERFGEASKAAALADKVVLFSDATEQLTRERVESSGAQGYVRKLGPERLREDVRLLLSAA
ncbi:MAG: hypothetical protein IPJ65_20275 [Archangiaceae bacterium]|nr:hypothetical protein [Archangiaceae bacterium]